MGAVVAGEGFHGNDAGERAASDSAAQEGDGLLEGAALSNALLAALESADLAAIQGLLISELTEKGTRFTAEQIPELLATLIDVDDFGLQKLALTHLERIEGGGADLVNGYLDYLTESRKAYHADEVLADIARIGGDAALGGLSELLRRTESDKLRAGAAEALAALQDERAAPVLREALFSSADPTQSRHYMDALATLGGERAVAAMIDFASAEGNEHALGAFRNLRGDSVGPLLAESLHSRVSAEYARTALKQLGSLADPRTLGGLERFLERADAALHREAIAALGRFSDLEAARVLERYARGNADDPAARLAARYAQRIHQRAASPGTRRTARGPGGSGERASRAR